MIGQAMLARHAKRREELAPRRWRKAIGIGLIVACVVPALLALPLALGRRSFTHCFDRSPQQRTWLQLRRLAYEGFPMWGMQHDDTRCPTIRELTREVSDDASNVRDAWHQPIEIRCGDPLPNGAHGILLRSAGPDGEFGTDDDVTSAD